MNLYVWIYKFRNELNQIYANLYKKKKKKINQISFESG